MAVYFVACFLFCFIAPVLSEARRQPLNACNVSQSQHHSLYGINQTFGPLDSKAFGCPRPDGGNDSVTMPGVWPPPSSWPFSEEDGGFSIEFRFLQNVSGLIADVDQEAVVAKALGKFATYNGFRGGSFPHHFMLVYPLHGIPWLLFRLHGSLFGSQEFYNKLVYLEIFSSFRITPSAYSCFGNRRARGLEVSWDYKVRGR